ncbi:autophagy-related protein 101-like protein [Dinothrombium tinctorium]|uniref:Autophagy-related protein 101 n=1 Tax=Dinothrombium tinctorium TaxID=1965070 RepID=A0A443QWM8_9ACAR|nr:autophagy-related protein 101-like protein [Dinothrombium tinctorium]
MNVRSNTFEIRCEGRQLSEVATALLQSILFYRTYGKVRCASPTLVESVNRDVRDFVDKLRESEEQCGTLHLEFYCKRKGRVWPINETPLIWEIWILKFDCGNQDKQKERIEDVLFEKLLTIIQIINSSKCYLPQMPNRDHLDTVFDTSHADAQPYIYKVLLYSYFSLKNNNFT